MGAGARFRFSHPPEADGTFSWQRSSKELLSPPHPLLKWAAMNARALLTIAVVLCAATAAHAIYGVSNEGTWPKELEPLRKQARTLVGPQAMNRHYAIPFGDRDAFQAAWPHILSVKSKGAPIFLSKGPNFFLGDDAGAGVVIHCPPEGQWDNPETPEAPIEGVQNPRVRWMNTNYVELVVDGEIVDLNRTSLPADTPIVDERFDETGRRKPPVGDK
jgi:hypothetical protein